MVQYGSGPTFQEQCPKPAPPPEGYDVWNEDSHGPVPSDVVTHARSLAYNMALPLGYADTIYAAGVALIVRVDPHSWTTNAQGDVVPGCYHGATVYAPRGGGVQPPAPANASSQSAVITIGFALGAVVSGLAIWDWFNR